jgi:hypothetical protein
MIEKRSVQDLRRCFLLRGCNFEDDGVLCEICLAIYRGIAVSA